MNILLTVIHLIACISIIALVLIQQGKGSDIGAAFGSGASTTVFGSPGAGGFMLKLTAFAAALFFATSIIMGYLASVQGRAANQDPLLNTMAIPAEDSGATPTQTLPGTQDQSTTAPLTPMTRDAVTTDQKENASDSQVQLPKDEKTGTSGAEKMPIPAE